MAKNTIYQYFVEGECEEKIVGILKTEYQLILPGKVDVFNVVNDKLGFNRTRLLKKGTVVVLVFDTDTGSNKILNENIAFLKSQKQIAEVICITQVCNLEDELKRSCCIKDIKKLVGSKSRGEFKGDMLKESDSGFKLKLDANNFDFSKFWNSNATGIFRHIQNESFKIKKDRRI